MRCNLKLVRDKGPLTARTPEISRRQMLGRLGAIGSGGLAASLAAACTASTGVRTSAAPVPTSSRAVPRSPAPVRTGVPANALNVRHFGARGDGRTDDTSAISAALAALRSGQILVFPAGTYRHSAVLSVATEGVTLEGPGRLYATAEQTSALRIDAPGVTVRRMVVAMGSTTRRWSDEDQHKIFVAPHEGISVSDVRIEGSAAAGLFCYGARDFRFTRVSVSDTRADGIHMTNGSQRGTVESPHISRSGDDGVAVVSYATDPRPCRHIDVFSPQVRTTTGGRGVSVVGGEDISYHDIDIDRSAAAAVYVACEGTRFVTRSVARVLVQAGVVTNANTNSADDQGAVLVYNGRAGASVADVTISDLTVTGTRASASRQIGAVADGPTDVLSNVVFRDLRLADEPMPYQGDAPRSSFTLVDVRAAGTVVRPA